MRRIAIAAAGALLALLLAVGGQELLRSRLEESEALRTSIEAAAAAQLGARLRAGPLAVDFWPAALRLSSPVLELEGGGRVELSGVEIVVDPRELLRGIARVESGSVDGPARLVSKGLSLDGSLAATLRPDPASGAWQLEGGVELASGGGGRIEGRIHSGSAFEGRVELEGVEAAPFAALLASDRGARPVLAGRFDGRLEPAAGAQPATLRLESADAQLQVPPVRLEGPVALVAQLPDREPGTPPTGFAIDASRARVEYAGGLTQASGRGASVEGKIAWHEDGRLRLEQVAVKITGFRGEHRARREGEERAAHDE